MRADLDILEDFELALCLTPKVGSGAFRKVIENKVVQNLDSKACFALSQSQLVDKLEMPAHAASLFANKSSAIYDALSKFKQNVGTKTVRLVTTESSIYPKRILDFCEKPPAFLFLYGNVRILSSKTFSVVCSRNPSSADLEAIERAAEAGVLKSMALVGGTNTDAYQRASIVPLRWGAPRILVLDRGLFPALGENLDDEPFRAARLWRYRFDPEADLVISRNRPFDQYARGNATARDELVVALSDEIDAISVRPGGNMDQLTLCAETLGKVVNRT